MALLHKAYATNGRVCGAPPRSTPTISSRSSLRRAVGCRCSSSDAAFNSEVPPQSRRALLAAGAATLLVSAGRSQAAEEQPIEVLSETLGTGQHAVRQGDLVLVHYTGRLEDGTVFDSTLGGLKYRDGGPGVFRPVVIRLSGYPQPGICLGLQQGIEGMKIGGQRTVKFGPALGFGDKPALAPYSIIPSGSTVQYDIELLRVSSVGPDLLMKGISRCGAGGAGAAADGCSNIQPAEFF